jgi:formate hydrogenlyase subunit 6/NADH:ubiquinone oxidoreductase subunit I
MFGWIWQALRTGIVTTHYPRKPEPQVPGAANRISIDATRWTPSDADTCAAVCPTGAMRIVGADFLFDAGLCILCHRCVDACASGAVVLSPDYELAVRDRDDLIVEIDGAGD